VRLFSFNCNKLKLTITLITVGFVILALSCIFCLLAQDNYQGLYFPKYNIDLGELDYDMETKTSFPFKNKTSKLINIRTIKADCRCTDASASKKAISPGESGQIAVTFRSSNQAGPENHKIVVFTDAPNQEINRLSISALVDPKIETVPRSISFGRVEGSQDVKSREVAVLSRFRGLASVVDVSTSSPYIKARFQEKDVSYKREVGRVTIELCGEPVSGKLSETVFLKTNTEKGLIETKIKVFADIVRKQ